MKCQAPERRHFGRNPINKRAKAPPRRTAFYRSAK